MPEYDLLIRGATVVSPAGCRPGDIAIAGGRIAALGPGLPGTAGETMEARGLHALPGVIDAHVHFNEPGRAHWEGLQTGSRALAAGGGTLFFDMPLNAHPPTLDAESFRLKAAAAAEKSLVDFALWGGLVPENLDRLEELAECGVVGFKAFMTSSGIEDFACVDDVVLRKGMKRAARLGLPVAVHAESEVITRQLTEARARAGRTSIRDYLESRPVEAELDAMGRALALAGETGCALHIVHVSCGAGIELVTAARRGGVDVSCETCPHYLTLTEADAEALGAPAKCAPPLRALAHQQALWGRLLAGEVTTLASDHSPAPPEMKRDENFFKVWGGISSVQHTLALLLTELDSRAGADAGGAPLGLLSSLLSDRVARRFKLPPVKGCLAPGADADLALVDLKQAFEVRPEDLLYCHAQSPYVGRRLRGRVVRTLLRGRTVFRDGKIVESGLGELVKPLR